MKPSMAIWGFVVLDTLCSAWTLTYFSDRIIHLGGSTSQIGLLVALRALCTTIAAPLLGRFSDKYGRRPVVLIVSGGTMITTILELFSFDLPTYYVSRLVFGLTRASITIANGMICDTVFDEKERTSAIGRNFSGMGVGFLVGSACGGVLASMGYVIPSLVNVGIGVIGFLWVYFFVSETAKVEKDGDKKDTGKKEADKNSTSMMDAVNALWSQPELRTLFIFHAALLLCNSAPQHAYLEFLRVDLQLASGFRALFFIAVGITGAVAQSNFSIVVDTIQVPNFVQLSIILCAVGSMIAPIAGVVVFTFATLIGTLGGVVTSLTLSTLSKNSPKHMAGTVNGIHESLSNLALVIGGLYCPVTAALHPWAPFWIPGIALFFMLFLKPSLLFAQKQKGNIKS